MTTFTMRYVNGHFVVVGPNISLMRFKSRAEGKTHYRGSPTKEVGADGVERMMRPQGRKGE